MAQVYAAGLDVFIDDVCIPAEFTASTQRFMRAVHRVHASAATACGPDTLPNEPTPRRILIDVPYLRLSEPCPKRVVIRHRRLDERTDRA